MFEIFCKFLLTSDDCQEFHLDFKKSNSATSIYEGINIYIYLLRFVISKWSLYQYTNHVYSMIFLSLGFLFWCISNHISIDTNCHSHRHLTAGQFFGLQMHFYTDCQVALPRQSAKPQASGLSENFITVQTF